MASAPGIYVHVPFCSAICPYCDFAVTVGAADRRQRFMTQLADEIELVAEDPWRGEAPAGAADTVYFGGGTPSLLEPAQLETILEALRHRLALVTDPWLAIEANPEDVSPARLAAWRDLGLRFLSLGIQSFDAGRLVFLGRRHTAVEARQAVEAALAAGIETVSLDLIYGLPGERPDDWRRELATAIQLAPHHLSCYQLTVEPGTAFAARRRRGRLRELPESRRAELFRLTHDLLARHGFEPYEVSNFAITPEHRSRHNRKYWHHAPYLGLGPSAHSFDGRRRWWNRRRLAAWGRELAEGRRPIEADERLTAKQLALEELMLALRTPEGIDLAGFRRRHGVDLEAANTKVLARLAGAGLIELGADLLRPTRAGLAVADGLAASLVLEARPAVA